MRRGGLPLPQRGGMARESEKKLVSIVVPVHNEEEVLPLFFREVRAVSAQLPEYDFEFVVVDDGSTDGTWDFITTLAREDARVRGAALSRNFGQMAALEAGIKLARGDAVITMDCDLEDPPSLLGALLARWEQGYDLVVAKRRYAHGKGWFKRVTSNAFYAVFNWLCDIELETGMADFRLVDRKVVRAIEEHFPEKELFLRGLFQWMGFPVATLEYEKGARAGGVSKYPLKKMLRLAWQGISSFSTFPLKLIALSGVTIAAVSFLLLMTMAVLRFVLGAVAYRDIAFLVVFIIFSNGLILTAIGVVALYLMQVYRQVQGRPSYLIWKRVNLASTPDRTDSRKTAP